MAENIIAFVIFLLVAAVMIIIGVSQVKSKEPVGFYTGEIPPKREQLSDVGLWNKKHGCMWIIYGLAIMGSYIINMFVKTEVIAMIIFCIVIVGALPIMMWYHGWLKKKYFRGEIEK